MTTIDLKEKAEAALKAAEAAEVKAREARAKADAISKERAEALKAAKQARLEARNRIEKERAAKFRETYASNVRQAKERFLQAVRDRTNILDAWLDLSQARALAHAEKTRAVLWNYEQATNLHRQRTELVKQLDSRRAQAVAKKHAPKFNGREPIASETLEQVNQAINEALKDAPKPPARTPQDETPVYYEDLGWPSLPYTSGAEREAASWNQVTLSEDLAQAANILNAEQAEQQHDELLAQVKESAATTK